MQVNYIIIQAGGRGSRLEELTQNKPKPLVPVDNLPMIFHIFRKFPEKKFIIIGDYKYEVLKQYTDTFSEVKHICVNASPEKGTCAGLKKAISFIPENEAFLLIWSDLILASDFELPKEDGDYLGIAKDFMCRWSYTAEGDFQEYPSSSQGVAGLFIFQNKEKIQSVTAEGEFVKWLQGEKLKFIPLSLNGTKEYGTIKAYRELEKPTSRPFNKLVRVGETLIKEGIDDQGKKLAVFEREWYQKAEQFGIQKIPKISNYNPLTMEYISGKNIQEYSFCVEEQEHILEDIILNLKELHRKKEIPVDWFSLQEAYLTKTLTRLEKVRLLIPYSDSKSIRINGRECRNIFYYYKDLEKLFFQLKPEKFSFIHGDCTFSNIILKEDRTPIFIDPRGYFGFTQFYGDPYYDWAKLYYSVVGNYDQFNRKNFKLTLQEENVTLQIESNGWERMEEKFFSLLKNEVSIYPLRLIHSIIWLSLTTYAWDNYDSICGAFYNGLYYLEEVMEHESLF